VTSTISAPRRSCRSFACSVGANIRIRVAMGGQGLPLLLLHGHPQTHVTCRKVTPALAARFTVVAADLRAYGDSSKPEGGANHVNYAKRSMARDHVALMRVLGHRHVHYCALRRSLRVAQAMFRNVASANPNHIDHLNHARQNVTRPGLIAGFVSLRSKYFVASAR
jgi:hypothetical protein